MECEGNIFSQCDFVSELLENWGVSKHIQEIFKAQGIDTDCLDKITEADINYLIPDTNIKDRIKFRHGLAEYKKENNLCSTATFESTSSLSLDDIDDPNNPRYKKQYISETEEDEKDTGSSSSRPQYTKNRIEEVDLTSILKSNNSGQLCLAVIKKNNKLDTSSRNNLVKSIVQFYIKEYGSMTRYDFEKISLSIELQIPNEHKETYYIRSQKYSKGKYIPARGKLVDKYHNQKRKLRSLGIIEQQHQRISPDANEFVTQTEEQDISPEEFEEHKIWLKFNKEPINEILEKWKKTSKHRVKDLYSHNFNSILQVFQEWPSYKLSVGYKLIEVDFDVKYPERDISLFKKWPEFCEKALPVYKTLSKANKYIEILEDHPSEDVRDYCIAVLIGNRITPTLKVTTTKQVKTTYKPSIAEAKSAFILHVQNDSEVITRLDSWRKAQLEKGLRCQPLIIVVGATETNLQEFYVSCVDILYKLDSFLKALDVCFKIFHCLNVEYPPEAIHIWTFIQKFFYDIHLKSDKKLSGVMSFLSDLK